jgi:cyclopropane fatty-acyl-phospholipid synthase-like methyltransferase
MFEDWYAPWGDLHIAVLTGKPVISKPHDQSEGAVRNYIMGMHYRGVAQARLLAEKVDVRGRCQMLDVAGGPGTFSIFMCRRHRRLKAVVLDLPQTLRITRELIAQFGVTERVMTHEGNYLQDDFPGGNDMLLLSSMMNQEPPEIVRSIFKKSYNALEPGGLLILQEQLLNAEKTGPLLPALIGVNQLIHTPGGRVYSDREFSEWLQGIGFEQVRQVQMPEPSPFTVLTAMKR